jgi:hypothetical protein
MVMVVAYLKVLAAIGDKVFAISFTIASRPVNIRT